MKNLIFDLDGTLGDTLPLCLKAFQLSIEPYLNQKLPAAEITKYFGISEEGIINTLLPEHAEEGIQSFITCYTDLLEQKTTIFPGVPELLATLEDNGHFITMVTGKSMITAEITLEKYGIKQYFKDIYPGSPTGEIKDNCINKLIHKHNLKRSETVYIGDAVSDIIASKNCGIAVIGAAWASTADILALEAANPNYIFTSFTDFADFLYDQAPLLINT